jgi:hypothetical protein
VYCTYVLELILMKGVVWQVLTLASIALTLITLWIIIILSVKSLREDQTFEAFILKSPKRDLLGSKGALLGSKMT